MAVVRRRTNQRQSITNNGIVPPQERTHRHNQDCSVIDKQVRCQGEKYHPASQDAQSGQHRSAGTEPVDDVAEYWVSEPNQAGNCERQPRLPPGPAEVPLQRQGPHRHGLVERHCRNNQDQPGQQDQPPTVEDTRLPGIFGMS